MNFYVLCKAFSFDREVGFILYEDLDIACVSQDTTL